MPARVRVFTLKDRHARALARQRVGTLSSRLLLPSTLERYCKALHVFFRSLKREMISYPSSIPFLDSILCEYIEDLWQDGFSKGLAYDSLCGIKHYLPATRHHLTAADRLMRVWTTSELPSRVSPLPVLWVYAIAAFARDRGWIDTAVALVLGFSTFTRTGELFSARKCDFLLSWDRGSGVWTLPLTKSGRRHGAPESVTITDPWIVRLLYGYLSRLHPSDLLLSCSPHTQRVRLQQACQALDIDRGFTWYSLRRGGATHALIVTQNLPSVCLQGRWTSLKTARIYLTEAQTRLAEYRLDRAHELRLHTLACSYRPSVDDLLYK